LSPPMSRSAWQPPRVSAPFSPPPMTHYEPRGRPRRGREMTKSTTRGFFFAGTFFFAALFILLTIHTHTTIAERTHEEGLTEPVRNGEHVWERYNCENCHTLLGEGAYYAPDLTQIVSQRGPAYLTQFLADPSKFYSETRDGRLMPTLGLSPDEIGDVIA